MDIGKALSLIKKLLKKPKNIIESKHYKDQLKERGIDVDKINETLKKGKLAGIEYQSESNRYKIKFAEFEQPNKDLNIILEIINDKRLRFITIFPSRMDRGAKR